jgi:hypothetical protein
VEDDDYNVIAVTVIKTDGHTVMWGWARPAGHVDEDPTKPVLASRLVGALGWATHLLWRDEGVRWVHGHHREDSEPVLALRAAYALVSVR